MYLFVMCTICRVGKNIDIFKNIISLDIYRDIFDIYDIFDSFDIFEQIKISNQFESKVEVVWVLHNNICMLVVVCLS